MKRESALVCNLQKVCERNASLASMRRTYIARHLVIVVAVVKCDFAENIVYFCVYKGISFMIILHTHVLLLELCIPSVSYVYTRHRMC